MAKRKPPKIATPRTVTTRSQTKRPQGAPLEIPQKIPVITSSVNNQNKVAKRRNKRHSMKYKQKLLLKLALERELNESDVVGAGVNKKFGADVKDGKDILPGDEKGSLRQEFHEERQVSLSQSPMGKRIQITCRNYSEISDVDRNKEGPSTIDNRNEPSVKTTNELSIGGDHNLSLASYDKLHLKKKEQFYKDLKSNANNRTFDKDDEVICLDTTEVNENAEDDILIVDDTLPSLIIIDDEPHDEKVTDKKIYNIDVIDLTTPQPSPARPVYNPPPAQTLSNYVQPFHHVPPPSKHIREIPHGLNGRFSPIQQLHFPPANRPHYVPHYPPVSGPPALNYNLQSNIYGNNFLNMGMIKTTGLRPIFIDGSNVALLHSNGKFLSVRGIQICIDYFKLRGHEVTAILPQVKKRQGQNSDPRLLHMLEKEGSVTFTPSRVINGRHVIPYDDRFIVQLAAVHQGIVVSNDNYKDLLAENPNLRDTIENRVLNPTFVRDMIIFPSDPLGRHGPKLDEFLRFP